MKLAIISCIHGNFEALNAVLSDIDQHKADQIYCLGDLVGYGPHPNAVVEMIRSLDIPTCQGCWDEDIVDLVVCQCLDLALCFSGNEADRPQAAAGIFDHDRLTEGVGLVSEHRFEDLLGGAVNGADDRHAGQNAIAGAHHDAAHEAGREGTDQGYGCHQDKKSQPREPDIQSDMVTQIGIGIPALGNQWDDLGIDEVDKPDRHYRGDGDGRRDQNAGEEICLQAREQWIGQLERGAHQR